MKNPETYTGISWCPKCNKGLPTSKARRITPNKLNCGCGACGWPYTYVNPKGSIYIHHEQTICPACNKTTKYKGLTLSCENCNGPICPHCDAHTKTTHTACIYQETKA